VSDSGVVMAGDAIVLLGLWLVLAAGWVPRRARFPVALTSFASAWTLAFLMAETRTPSWRGVASTLAIVISLVLLIAVGQRAMPSDSEGGDGDGGGGPGRRPPDRPNDGGGPTDPAWWPEFERDFARHVARLEQAKTGRNRLRVDR
jgi:hypothetical protein